MQLSLFQAQCCVDLLIFRILASLIKDFIAVCSKLNHLNKEPSRGPEAGQNGGTEGGLHEIHMGSRWGPQRVQ